MGFPALLSRIVTRFFLVNFGGNSFGCKEPPFALVLLITLNWTANRGVLNRCLETYLICFAHHKPKSWSCFLPWAEYWYNTSFHTAAQTAPFCIVYGHDPPTLLSYEAGSSVFSAVDQQLLERDAILVELRQQLHRAQQCMKA